MKEVGRRRRDQDWPCGGNPGGRRCHCALEGPSGRIGVDEILLATVQDPSMCEVEKQNGQQNQGVELPPRFAH
jgi:hypothetical protein